MSIYLNQRHNVNIPIIDRLLPCPFCGSEPELKQIDGNIFRIYCSNLACSAIGDCAIVELKIFSLNEQLNSTLIDNNDMPRLHNDVLDYIKNIEGVMDSYELAALHKMLEKSEVDLLKRCAEMLPPSPVIVNIGANVGTSAIAMLEQRPDAFIFSVDVKREREREYIDQCNVDPARIVRLLGDSKEVGKYFPYQVDMVFVDGDHTDAGVSGDIEAWIPKCRYIAAYHDYHHPRYKEKPNVHLDEIVDKAMKDWVKVDEARFLVAFRRTTPLPELQDSDYVTD